MRRWQVSYHPDGSDPDKWVSGFGETLPEAVRNVEIEARKVRDDMAAKLAQLDKVVAEVTDHAA
jgi:hypothetical protein